MPPSRRTGHVRHLAGSLFLLEARVHEESRNGIGRPALGARNDVGVEHWQAGRFPEAAAVFEPLVSDCRMLLGGADPDTLIAEGNLAMLYIHLDRREQGFELLTRNLVAREQVFGEVGPATMAARHAQATACQLVGRPRDALAAFTTVAAQRARVLGPAHPDTLTSRVGLALARADSGDTAAAVPGLAAVLRDAEQSLGPHTVPTVTIRIHLADCHLELGNLYDAAEGLSQAATDYAAVLGTDSPLVAALRSEANALQEVSRGHDRGEARMATTAYSAHR
jgi:hypothetical protein